MNVKGEVAGADRVAQVKGRQDDERFLVSPELASALMQLRRRVKQQFGPEYDIWLNGAYDSSGRAHKSAHSLHCTGRAVDLDLFYTKPGKKHGGKANNKVDEFAALVNEVFNTQEKDGRPLHGWVLHEGNHVHASLESPSLGGNYLPEDTEEPTPPQPTQVLVGWW